VRSKSVWCTSQKVSDRGFYVSAGGLNIENLIKTPLIYSVSYFNLGGLSALFEGLRAPKSPSDDGAECTS